MKTLSIFVDESGDFGEYDYHSPYYIISLVFHEQINNISENVNVFENKLKNIGFPNHCIHTGAIIRGEDEYRFVDIEKRKKLLRCTKAFIDKLEISYKSFYVEKKHINDQVAIITNLSKLISNFIKEHLEYFTSFDKIIIYYDKGQLQINLILTSIFNALLENVEFRKVKPIDYRLFQVADFMCSMMLYKLKVRDNNMSKSEVYFFEDKRTLNKKYLVYLKRKEKD